METMAITALLIMTQAARIIMAVIPIIGAGGPVGDGDGGDGRATGGAGVSAAVLAVEASAASMVVSAVLAGFVAAALPVDFMAVVLLADSMAVASPVVTPVPVLAGDMPGEVSVADTVVAVDIGN